MSQLKWGIWSCNPIFHSELEMLNQVEDEGYEPKFIKYESGYFMIYARKKDDG